MQIEKLLEEQMEKLYSLNCNEYGAIHNNEVYRDWHKQSLKQLIDGLVESLDGKREKDLSDKDIEDRLRVFTLTPSSEESIKEFVKVIGGISAKMGKNKAINDQISYLEKIRKQLE